MTTEDTIAAISTPIGEGGIGIVRISGRHALRVADAVFKSRSGKKLVYAESHKIIYGFVEDPKNAERVDEVLVTVMRAPHSYTREDVVEINCHGGPVPLRRVLGLVLLNGARHARPGEFTLRAFLNGRLDLSQAEAVADIIRARTERAGRLALEQLGGRLSEEVNRLRESLLVACALIEAHIDFPEEELGAGSDNGIGNAINNAIGELTLLSKSYDEGRLFREGLRTAIVGRPNVGKSSLLNALLKTDKAIVTELPGTTRDVVEGEINLNGLPLVVMDTAGIREAHDMAEAEGVRRSLRAIDEADLVLAVMDGSEPMHPEDGEVLARAREKEAFIVLNKCDKGATFLCPETGLRVLSVSAKTGEGVEALKEAIFGHFITDAASGDTPVVTNLRHKTSMDLALVLLESALRSLGGGSPLEIVAIDLREAVDRLGEITGAVTTEDVLERIFSDFCIGK